MTEVEQMQMTSDELRRERRLSIPAAICGLLVPVCLFGTIGVTAEAGSRGVQADRTPIPEEKQQSTLAIDSAAGSLLRIGGVNGRPSADLAGATEIVALEQPTGPINGFDVSSRGARAGWLVMDGEQGAVARPLVFADGSLGAAVPLAGVERVRGLALAQRPRPIATADDPEADRPPPAAGYLLDGQNRLRTVEFPDGSLGAPVAVGGLAEGEQLVALAGGDDGSVLLALGVDEAGDGRLHRIDTTGGAATDARADGAPVGQDLSPDGGYGMDLDLDSGTVRVTGESRHFTVDNSGAGSVREHQSPGTEAVDATALVSVIEPGEAELPTRYAEYAATDGTWLMANLLKVLTLVLALPLALFLWGATRRRRPVPGFLAGLAVVGAAVFALPSLAAHFALVDIAEQFLASGPRTWLRAVELRDGSTAFRISTALEPFASVPIAAWLAWGSYEAMEAGLLPRFIGLLGLVTAIPLIVFPLPGVILAIIWIVCVALISLGLWTGGRPPAWAAGRAILSDIDPRDPKERPKK